MSERLVHVAPIADVAHHRLIMVLDPIPNPEVHPPPPGFAVRTFRPEDADADRRAWGAVEVSAGEFTEGTPEQCLSDAIAKFNEEFMPYVSVRCRPPTNGKRSSAIMHHDDRTSSDCFTT